MSGSVQRSFESDSLRASEDDARAREHAREPEIRHENVGEADAGIGWRRVVRATGIARYGGSVSSWMNEGCRQGMGDDGDGSSCGDCSEDG